MSATLSPWNWNTGIIKHNGPSASPRKGQKKRLTSDLPLSHRSYRPEDRFGGVKRAIAVANNGLAIILRFTLRKAACHLLEFSTSTIKDNRVAPDTISAPLSASHPAVFHRPAERVRGKALHQRTAQYIVRAVLHLAGTYSKDHSSVTHARALQSKLLFLPPPSIRVSGPAGACFKLGGLDWA